MILMILMIIVVCMFLIMNFIKNIRPLALINQAIQGITGKRITSQTPNQTQQPIQQQINKSTSQQVDTKQTQYHKRKSNQSHQQTATDSNTTTNDSQLTSQQSQNFILGLHKSAEQQRRNQNAAIMQKDVFADLQIEPHYLGAVDYAKLLQFQFQLGTHQFLERTQSLHQQAVAINKAIKQCIAENRQHLPFIFQLLSQHEQKIQDLIQKITLGRKHLTDIKGNLVFRVQKIMRKKIVIKQKISLLSKVKSKNEAAFLPITNIDQAFATQQNRSKLYHKICQLSIQNTLYIATIKQRLISTASNVRQIVKKGIQDWLKAGLSNKHIQKLAFLIYFMQRQNIYRENSIEIDLKNYGQPLKTQIGKLSEWKEYHYVKDAPTRQRIQEFLSTLQQQLE